MDKYNEKITFYLPGAFTSFFELLSYLMENYSHRKEIFKDNVELGCIYGSPKCIWNGGHYASFEYSKAELQQWKNFSQKYNIPIRFTFTNSLLKEEHLKDCYGNLLLEEFNTGKNEIICVSDLLEKYIRNKYGKSFKYISSTSKSLINKELQMEEINKDYYLTVLDIDHNADYDFLKQIQEKEKVELLCNSTCQDNCPRKKAHYTYISKMQLEYGGNQLEKDPFSDCPHQRSLLYERKILHKNFISPDSINNIYIPLGFKHFKLEGRFTTPPEWIETIVYFLIKDEYALQVRQEMFKLIW